MVQLYQSGKPRSEIIRKYDLTPSTFDKRVNDMRTQDHLKKKTTLQKNKKGYVFFGNETSNLKWKMIF
ncbi:hypothetical protein JCM19045_354 [Bacillus sp. JCM 19045]|nr:hypothetical protein JCM19045_354 [Bacillus sp. JCM 19045]